MTESSPLVSVLLPVHNGEKTVGASIKSILAGTYRNVQVVVCDDASTDGTVEIVQSIDDSRITLLHNSRNLGPGPSRDRAIDASQGRWLTFLDADDAWTPNRLADLTRAAQDQEDVIVFDDLMLCHDAPRGMLPWRRAYGAGAFGATSGSTVDVTPAKWAASKQFVMQPLISSVGLRECGVRHSGRRFQEDTEFFLRLIASGFRLRYVSHANYLYRITPGSLSSVDHPGFRTRQILEEALPLFANDEDMRQVLERKIAYRRFTWALKSGDFGSALRHVNQDPGLLAELASRIFGMAYYHSSRIAYRASRR